MTITSGKVEGGAGTRVAVLGAGSWGTALAMQLVRAGTVPLLWDWDARHLEAMRVARRNEQFLPDYPLPQSLILEPDLERAVRAAEEVIIVSAGGAQAQETIRGRAFPGPARGWSREPDSSCMSPLSSCLATAGHWLSSRGLRSQSKWRLTSPPP